MAKVGHAGETICKVAESGKFDMVVMGSVATQVLSQSKVPVLMAR